MKALLDTSVLVAAFYEEHVHHAASFALLRAFSKREASCAAHGLAEVYATLTGMPGRDRIAGPDAMLYLRSIRDRLTVIQLTEEDYMAAAESAAGGGIASGGIHDALIGYCALKVKATALYTWNLRHFQRLPHAIASRVRSPADRI